MKIGITSFTARGAFLCRRLFHLFGQAQEDCRAYVPERFMQRGWEQEGILAQGLSAGQWARAMFAESRAMIFVGAAGIAVRSIAPFVKDKMWDPPVVVVDEAGRFAVPLLSGHVGGANELAERIAGWLGAVPVITTATDVNGVFAVDVYASRCGLAITDRQEAKRISAALLAGETVGFFSDFSMGPQVEGERMENSQAEGTRRWSSQAEGTQRGSSQAEETQRWSSRAEETQRESSRAEETRRDSSQAEGTERPITQTEAVRKSRGQNTVRRLPPGCVDRVCRHNICITTDDGQKGAYRRRYGLLPDGTLRLIPKAVVLGIGCRRGTRLEALEGKVTKILGDHGIDILSVKAIATIDIKQREPGLCGLAALYGWELRTYGRDELERVEGIFAESDFVRDTVGVGNVCERAAVASGGTLLIHKQAGDGITVAAAMEHVALPGFI